jgi:hypothetical protein
MHPYVQDLRVAMRRMDERSARSQLVRLARAAPGDLAGSAPTEDPGRLVAVVRLHLAEPIGCRDCTDRSDERMAS